MSAIKKDRPTFDECGCSYCTDADISSPGTGGEYPGIDTHVATLEARLADAARLLSQCRCGFIDHDHSAVYRDERDEFVRRHGRTGTITVG